LPLPGSGIIVRFHIPMLFK